MNSIRRVSVEGLCKICCQLQLILGTENCPPAVINIRDFIVYQLVNTFSSETNSKFGSNAIRDLISSALGLVSKNMRKAIESRYPICQSSLCNCPDAWSEAQRYVCKTKNPVQVQTSGMELDFAGFGETSGASTSASTSINWSWDDSFVSAGSTDAQMLSDPFGIDFLSNPSNVTIAEFGSQELHSDSFSFL